MQSIQVVLILRSRWNPSPCHSSQPNPFQKKFDPTQPNLIQPNPWMDPTHVPMSVSDPIKADIILAIFQAE